MTCDFLRLVSLYCFLPSKERRMHNDTHTHTLMCVLIMSVLMRGMHNDTHTLRHTYTHTHAHTHTHSLTTHTSIPQKSGPAHIRLCVHSNTHTHTHTHTHTSIPN